MNIRIPLFAAALTLGAARLAPAFVPQAGPPNFLVIFVDDLGLDQLACYDDVNQYPGSGAGGSNYPYAHTPNISALAAAGVRFDQARAMPLCSPSRAALQSGVYGRRTGCGTLVHGLNQGSSDYVSANFREYSVAPAPDQLNIAELLSAQSYGYDCAMLGKLHLQLDPDDPVFPFPGSGLGPPWEGSGTAHAVDALGYRYYRGNLRNPNIWPYPAPPSGYATREISFTYYRYSEAIAVPGGATATSYIDIADPNAPYRGPYVTSKDQDVVADWLVQSAQEPFFVVWNPNDVHGPYQWPPKNHLGEGHGFDLLAPDGGQAPIFENTRGRAKLEYLDSAIGNLFSEVEAERPGLLDDTVVILMGDNGTESPWAETQTGEARYPAVHPLHQTGDDTTGFTMAPYMSHRMKGTPYETGVRVPLIVKGPGVVSPGRASAALVDVTDVFETVRDVIATSQGQTYTPLAGNDSVSFGDILRGQQDYRHPRDFSWGGIFTPNGVFQPGVNPPRERREYYIRLDRGTNLTSPADDHMWKLVYHYRGATAGTPAAEGYAFYDVLADPLETQHLGLQHPEYAQTKADWLNLF